MINNTLEVDIPERTPPSDLGRCPAGPSSSDTFVFFGSGDHDATAVLPQCRSSLVPLEHLSELGECHATELHVRWQVLGVEATCDEPEDRLGLHGGCPT